MSCCHDAASLIGEQGEPRRREIGATPAVRISATFTVLSRSVDLPCAAAGNVARVIRFASDSQPMTRSTSMSRAVVALTGRESEAHAGAVRMVIACVVWLVGCGDKQPLSAGEGSGAAPVAPPAPAPPAAAGGPALPLSADVLPSGEATPDARVVVGDGYLFQIPKDFQQVAHPSGNPAYAGIVKGFGGPAQMTFWAQRAPFTGDLEQLVKREVDAATQAGATEAKPGPVMAFVGGGVKQGYAMRLTIKTPERFELRTVVAHDGAAYIHHCETPNVPNAWANVGSDCIVRGTTFHVAPPPPSAPRPAAEGPAPPQTKGVVFLGSKVEGKARQRADVGPWVEKSVAPYLKPCLKGQRDMTTWRVTFEVAKDGKAGSSKVSGGDPEAPADAAAASCVAKALRAAKLDGAASDKVTVSAVLMVNSNAD